MSNPKKKIDGDPGNIFERCESNVQSYARSFPATFTLAKGSILKDINGRCYLDFLAGAGSLNYGHNNPNLKKALMDYIARDGITHSLDLHTLAKEEFLTALQEHILAPGGLDYRVQFPGPTGTNAVEAALKLARKVTGRQNIISFTNGFHGMTLGALAVTGNKHHRQGAGVELPHVTFMPFDKYLGENIDTVSYMQKRLEDPSGGVELPAAIILETVQGEGGLNVASGRWLRDLQNLCRRFDILMIIDDIQAGCGRTGGFFSFEEAGIRPDIVTCSKSLSGYGLPLSIVLLRPDLDIWKPGEHNGTFRGNNHAFVTATKALNHYWQTPAFKREIISKGHHITERLEECAARFPHHLGQVKGRGMMKGITCLEPAQAAMVTARAYEKGLIIERAGPHDEVIKCLMPLTTSLQQIDEGLDILQQSFSEIFGQKGSTHSKLKPVG